jgi:hypothetical protein
MVTAKRVAPVIAETAIPGIRKEDVRILIVAYPLTAAFGSRQLARFAT